MALSILPSILPSCAPSAPRAAYTAAQLAAVVELSDAAIAPDGGEVAFVSDRTGARELWTAAWRGEPRQRTRAGERVSDPAYAPDGSALVFAMDHGGDERNDLWLLRRGAAAPERLTETPISEEQARFSPDGRSLAFVADRDRPFRFNVEIMDLATRTTRQLTHEDVNVRSPRWSRDGKSVAAVRTPDDQRGDLLILDVASGAARRIVAPARDGMLAPVDFLPDGRLLALATNAAGFLQLAIVELADDRVAYVGPGDWDVEDARVAGDGAVVYARNVRGQSEVSLAAGPRPFSAPARVLAAGGVVDGLGLDRTGARVVVVRESSDRPTELVDLGASPAAVIVPAAAGQVAVGELARASRRDFASFDGRTIDAYVWAPPVARLGRLPPCVVLVHGGPNGQSRDRFMPDAQALAEAGFVVVAPNYRGSTGYGRAFEDLDNKDWGGGDLRDLAAVVDALARGHEIDPARAGIMGGSFGGYLALRAITAVPDLFHAAVEMYGMPDLVEDFRLTQDRFGPWYLTEMGDPQSDAALFRDRSPIRSLDRVRAPLLVLQGENDTCVPRAESDLVVEALRRRGQRVEYTVYPAEGHGFTHRESQVDALSRAVEFFTRHVGPRP